MKPAQVRRIAHEVLHEHVNYPAPQGHKGLEKLMPTTSRAQQKAMFAAAGGHSTLGIPQKVGMEFARADIKRAHGGKIPPKDRGKLEALRGRAKTSAERAGPRSGGKSFR
jgi:hypothetical protein